MTTPGFLAVQRNVSPGATLPESKSSPVAVWGSAPALVHVTPVAGGDGDVLRLERVVDHLHGCAAGLGGRGRLGVVRSAAGDGDGGDREHGNDPLHRGSWSVGF